ncbi:MAG: hypothetical protein NC086_10265, partial [Alistipes sp.]|nr:hypothetical protein [Alistipes sp.]
KKQIDNLMASIERSHRSVEKLIRSGKRQDAAALLEECQGFAINIGQIIEETEGEGTQTVKLLEEYCEILYNLHENLLNNEAVIASEASKNLNKAYKRIRLAGNSEIHVTKEAVFLPYKASMWDSLESVWRRYDADPEWEALVIPIPYYDKNPDGSVKEFHYEGELYPKDVPVVSFQEYDLEKMHPDRIYIHNPYDEGNFVTSVHPAFYSKKIKEYTDKLIYIPYFVLAEPDPKSKAAIENVGKYARTPGVVHAHEVIVQSENMRKCYIESLVELAGEQTRKIWEQKIKGSGSPKFDKITNTSRENVAVPAEWKDKLYKSDGTPKKVVLYNTCVTALLQESEQMLKKIRDVFEFFKENKDKVTLLWRPHPLTQATIGSLRPELREEYENLVKWYRNDDIGIYDDSPDLDRAVIIADAYYGDGSSVVQLCQAAGKPVMIQNVHVRYER